MHSFKRLLLVVFAITSSAVFAAPTEPALKRAEAIKVVIQPKFGINSKTPLLSSLKERMAALNIPAVSIAFMEGHKISWTFSEGVIDFVSQQEIDENTLFQTASLSDPMLAAVLLKYRQEHGVDLTTDVTILLNSRQLPKHKWSTSNPLSHSTGSAVPGTKSYAVGEGVPSITEVLNEAGPANAKTILNSLNTDNNNYTASVSAQLAKNAALPHQSTGLPVSGNAYTDATLATAGLWISPSDLLKLASKIQSSYQGEDNSFVTNKTVSQMLTPQTESMGNGFFLEKYDGSVTSFSQGGVNKGFKANVFIHAQTGDGIAIMTNSDNGGELINDLLSSISDIYGWNAFSHIEKNEIVLTPEPPPVIIEKYKIRVPLQSTSVLVAEGEQF